jgi:hypothetical protein
MKQDFKDDLQELFELINSDKPFAFMRFADGEIGVMQGILVNGSDNWISPNYQTQLGLDLHKAITRIDNNVYYGISCQCCDNEGKNYLLNLIKNNISNITFSNLFVNGNYESFLLKFNQINKPAYVIANESAGFYNFPLEILGFLPVPNDCVNFWEQTHNEMKELLINAFSEIKGELFLISAGPMSEAIIDFLWSINPTNQYIDVGSSIAEYIHGKPIRDFAYKQSLYHNKNCVF